MLVKSFNRSSISKAVTIKISLAIRVGVFSSLVISHSATFQLSNLECQGLAFVFGFGLGLGIVHALSQNCN